MEKVGAKVEDDKETDAKRQRVDDAKAVMFCPYKAGGELAKKL